MKFRLENSQKKHIGNLNRYVLPCVVIFAFYASVYAQENAPEPVDEGETTKVVDSIAKLVKQYYVSLEIGRKIGDLIVSKNKNGAYKHLSDPNELASQLTSDLRSVNGDLHMNVRFTRSGSATGYKQPFQKVDRSGQWTNYGFQEIKVLDGNIGYLKINHFTIWDHFEAAKKVVTSSFGILQNTDALIIDVRNNGGGFEAIIAYLISYLYEGEPIHLSDYYYRYKDERYGIWTSKDIPGKKLPDIPVYVLVNNRSASAAESLAYMLKHLKRATIIGETTMGAGNGAMTHKVSERFSVSIASETTINTITKTSFEKTGVIPDIKTSDEAAFSTGYRLALGYLKDNNTKNISPFNYEKLIDFIPANERYKKTDNDVYEKYTGKYTGAGIEIIIAVHKTGLYAKMPGDGRNFKLIPGGDHIFIVDNLKERIQFVFNENNEVVKLIGIDSPMELEKITDKK